MSAQRFNVAILLMGLSLIFWINDGIGSQHEDEIQSILYIFPDYLFPDESHIWPLDQPTQEGQTSSQEHDICGVVGEFRTEGGNHFHGGVDMPACNGTDVYSVMKDVFVIESTGSRISIRGWFHVGGPGSGWNRADDGDDDAWYTTRYLHIKNRKVQYKDKIIWNQSLTGRYYSEGWYYYPQHLLIADVDDYEPSGCDGDHLHYGEVSYNDHYDTFIYGYLIVNPLNPPNPSDPNDPRPLLNPFTDDNSDDPEILGKWLYYQENGSSLSRGSGSQSDPYLAEDKFDIKLRARDEIGTRNVAPWALAYNLYDEGGSEVSGGSYYHEYYFDLLGPINTDKGTSVVSDGVTKIYATPSTKSDYYYWITNNYSYTGGGTDGIFDLCALSKHTKYEVRAKVVDTNYENNYDVENIWFIRVMYGDVGLDEEIEVTDAQKILLWIVQQISLTNYQLVMAEVSGNGTVTAYDASLILQYIQDIIECFPVQEVCPPSCPKPVVFSGDAEVAMGGLLRSGPIVRIPIYVKNAEGVFSAKIAGKYDLKNLEFIKITTTELSKEYLMEYNERNGEVLIAMASAKAVVSKAPMAYAHFRVIGDRGNNDDFTITEFQVNEGPVFTSPAKPVTEHPQDFALNQNHPNPFNPETHISFQLLEISGQTSKHVTLKIYNALGQEVQTLMNEQKEPGYYTVTWDGIDNQGCEVSSGVYFYRLQAENIVQTKKMVLMR